MINKKLRNTLLKIFGTFSAIIIILAFALYGPFDWIRDTWVTSAMTTLSHQWMATSLFSKEAISTIMKKHSIVLPNETTDQSLITVNKDAENKCELININKSQFRGYLLKIYNPEKVRLVACSNLGERGEKLDEMVNSYKAIAAINGSGFMDTSGHTKGGVPTGLIMSDKNIYYSDHDYYNNIVGLTYDGKLALGVYSKEELLKSNVRDAVSFDPILIINGKPTKINGNGGWGIAPRTAIGQTKDGVLMFLVIDGRQLSSVGATVKDVQDIFIEYGAINAANLDGGSSSIMMYNGKTVNFPPSSKTGRYLPSAFIVES